MWRLRKHLAYPATVAPRYLFTRFGGMRWGTWLPWRMRPMSERPVWQWAMLSVSLKAQDARVRGDSNDEVPMVPTIYGRLATAMTTSVPRRHGTSDGDGGDNEPMCSLELASSWARLGAACGRHALAEFEPLITTTLEMLPPQHPTVARAGCVAETRSNNEQIARSFDGLSSLVHLSAFAADIFPKLQADISEHVNLLRFVKLAPTFSNRARPQPWSFFS
jgi:hypothetical protein